MGRRRRRAARVGATVPARARERPAVLDHRGGAHVVLDGVEHVAGPSSLVYIPAGVVHKNRNDGDGPRAAPRSPRAGAEPVQAGQHPGVRRRPWTGHRLGTSARRRRVRVEPRARVRARSSGVADSGCSSIIVNAARVSPESTGTSWHIHRVRPAVLGARGHAARRGRRPGARCRARPPRRAPRRRATPQLEPRSRASSATSRSSCQPRPSGRSTPRSRGRSAEPIACRRDGQRGMWRPPTCAKRSWCSLSRSRP